MYTNPHVYTARMSSTVAIAINDTDIPSWWHCARAAFHSNKFFQSRGL